jgi:hypothetical protein
MEHQEVIALLAEVKRCAGHHLGTPQYIAVRLSVLPSVSSSTKRGLMHRDASGPINKLFLSEEAESLYW